MGDIGISYNQDQDADLAREQQASDPILSQLALATIILSLEVDLLAFVRALNAADAIAAPREQASHRPFARLLRSFATVTGRFPWAVGPSPTAAQHSPTLTYS
jgi:hypothetical protein